MTVVSIVSVFGVALGLFLFFPLLWTIRKNKANIWLAVFLLALILTSVGDILFSNRVYLNHPRLVGWFDLPIWTLGFSYYFYARGLLGLKRQKYFYLHFLPLVIGLALQAIITLFIPTDLLIGSLNESYLMSAGFDGFSALVQFYLALYFLFVFQLILQFRKQLHDMGTVDQRN